MGRFYLKRTPQEGELKKRGAKGSALDTGQFDLEIEKEEKGTVLFL